MLEALRLVRGAVAEKDLVPVLTHFHIYDGRIQGTNGRVTIDAPCEQLAGFEITVPAERFLKAVDTCYGEPKLKVTEAGRLSISKGSFRALIPLGAHGDFPRAPEEGESIDTQPERLLSALRAVHEFIATDATRPWACGVLFRGDYVYATNNIIMVRAYCPTGLDGINLPSMAVAELLRIKAPPIEIKVSEKAAYFFYEGGHWLRTNLFDLGWPDVDAMFIEPSEFAIGDGIPDENKDPDPIYDLYKAVSKIKPFCPDIKVPVIHLGEDGVSTNEGEMSASVSGIDLHPCKFHADMLLSALNIADKIDFSLYPKACPFVGEPEEGIKINGLIMGMR